MFINKIADEYFPNLYKIEDNVNELGKKR